VEIQGEASQYVRVGDEGYKVAFSFCPKCGATVHYSVEGYDVENIAIPVGAFADPSFPGPTFSVYEERMHKWVNMPQDIEHIA
jgi:hypothetical protein